MPLFWIVRRAQTPIRVSLGLGAPAGALVPIGELRTPQVLAFGLAHAGLQLGLVLLILVALGGLETSTAARDTCPSASLPPFVVRWTWIHVHCGTIR